MEEINSDGSSRKAFHVKGGGWEMFLMKLWDEEKLLMKFFFFRFLFCLLVLMEKIKDETFRSRA
jgi:hypothetical protein